MSAAHASDQAPVTASAEPAAVGRDGGGPGPATLGPDLASALAVADPGSRSRMLTALQHTHGNAYVQRLARGVAPRATASRGRVLARTPTADQSRWREIFTAQRTANPSTAHVRTLIEAFRDDRISGSSSRDRYLAILALTGSSSPGPSAHFDDYTIRAIGTESSPTGTGDTGFRRELRDSVQYRANEQGQDVPMHRLSSDQIGHFLTATHFGYSLTERDNYIAEQYRRAAANRAQHPYLSILSDLMDPTTDMAVQYAFEKEQYLRAMIGHEMVADRAFSGIGITSTAAAPLMASGEDVQNFLAGRLDLLQIDDSKRGNSYQDLLLTWVGYRFGQHMSNGVFPSRQEAARWLELMLAESDLNAVPSNDAFGPDAAQMRRMLDQFRAIQQRTHPAPQPQPELQLRRAVDHRVAARALQRAWTGARSGGWNEADRSVAGTLRIPIEGLTLGNQRADPQPSTAESAAGRAIVIVPDNVDVTSGTVEVLLHFHGLNIGYRERKTAAGPGPIGSVRDVETDLIPQQLARSGRNMIAVLAQGAAETPYGFARFDIANPQAYVNSVLALVPPHLPAARRPTGSLTAGRIVVGGHSGGGPNAVAAAVAGQAAPMSSTTPATDPQWASSSPLLLFDAINNQPELRAARSAVESWLNEDLARLTAPGANPTALLAARGLKLRSTWSTGAAQVYRACNIGGTYTSRLEGTVVVDRDHSLDGSIDKWFATHSPSLSAADLTTWRQQYRVERVVASHEFTMGVGSAVPSGSRSAAPTGVTAPSARVKVPDYVSGGNLDAALSGLRANPVPPAPMSPAPAAVMPTRRGRSPKLMRQVPADPPPPPPTDADRASAASILIEVLVLKAQEHRVNTDDICRDEAVTGTPTGVQITYLDPDYVRRTLEARAANQELSAAFDGAVSRVLGTRRSEWQLRARAFVEVPAMLTLLEREFVLDPNASTLDLLGPDRSRHFRQEVRWGRDDYPGNRGNDAESIRMARELARVRPERRANRGPDRVLDSGEYARLRRMPDFITGQLRHVDGLARAFVLNVHAKDAFIAARTAAAADGVTLEPGGGAPTFWRDAATAAANADRADNAHAVARFSSHMLGLAVDLKMSFAGHRWAEVTTRPMGDVVAMRTSPAHKWMWVHGATYGFYPLIDEPWHWEYNPPGFHELFMREYREWLNPTPTPTPTPG